MRAYIFWHRPYEDVAGAAYEGALAAFHESLAAAPAPGFLGSAAHRISATPWLGDRGGYEDWNLVEASWALDPLNQFAVSGPMRAVHSQIAGLMDVGYGGLYNLVLGDGRSADRSRVCWLTRPRGVADHGAVLEKICNGAGEGTSCWRRQMVLGPGREFAVVGGADLRLDLPDGWDGVYVDRERLRGEGADR